MEKQPQQQPQQNLYSNIIAFVREKIAKPEGSFMINSKDEKSISEKALAVLFDLFKNDDKLDTKCNKQLVATMGSFASQIDSFVFNGTDNLEHIFGKTSNISGNTISRQFVSRVDGKEVTFTVSASVSNSRVTISKKEDSQKIQ